MEHPELKAWLRLTLSPRIGNTTARKLLAEFGEPLVGRLLLIDGFGSRFRELKVKRDPACSVCGVTDGQ